MKFEIWLFFFKKDKQIEKIQSLNLPMFSKKDKQMKKNIKALICSCFEKR